MQPIRFESAECRQIESILLGIQGIGPYEKRTSTLRFQFTTHEPTEEDRGKTIDGNCSGSGNPTSLAVPSTTKRAAFHSMGRAAVPATARNRPTAALRGFKISKPAFAAVLLISDAILVALIIAFVPYTKIDWDAYMSQVDGFLAGERDYTNLKGDTGPLVYPAGFLYVYSAIKFITGGQVFPAQILFGILYIVNLGIVLFIYVKTDALPWWALGLLCLSKRVHSIFMLRLFNDCFAMTLLHAAIALLLCQKWYLVLIIFSAAVSIKMNVLLYAPPLFLLMLKGMSNKDVLLALLAAALLQILLGLPFLLSHPLGYISRAFNLGRVFIHFWSVNFKFVPEHIFVSKGFASVLLALHLILLITFAHYRWSKHEKGILHLLQSKIYDASSQSFSLRRLLFHEPISRIISREHITTLMFVGNFIGIVFARSLHYQFYSWYFYSLPFLLWKTPFPTLLRLILFGGVELCWNIYPSSFYSSLILLCIHLTILWGLWVAPAEYPYYPSEKSSQTKKK